ncbi:MAG: hypothetical protein JWL91_288 [Sphingomonas bacterium]|nr:nucleotidyltransferase family protein [Sphingomonas bacterium]MDB5688412.1 hypothetical protein [Sphingomonas bacterium]
MRSAHLLARALTDPATTRVLNAAGWTALLTMARAEQLIGSLAFRLEGVDVPAAVGELLADARRSAVQAQVQALWEAEMARRALAPRDVPVILLKGTAYSAAGLSAASGRAIGDLDILVPEARIGEVESALIAAGWEWVKEDAYDDLYYRRWMHELPPLIHRARDRMIDVHHTILPPTARPTPDAAALIAASLALPGGLRILSPADMVVHSATHLFADGDLAGGLRNLWDIDRLVRQFAERPGFWEELGGRAQLHQLLPAVARALRLARAIYATPVDAALAGRWRVADGLFRRRLLARDGWGRERDRGLRFGFYIRSHWLRMPPAMLARHLWTKARKGA